MEPTYSPKRGLKVTAGMCLGSLIGTIVLHGVRSTRVAWFDALARVGLIIVLCALFELVKWRVSKRASLIVRG